jgi:hypothetical protein
MVTNQPNGGSPDPYFVILYVKTSQRATISKHDIQVSGDASITDIQHHATQFLQTVNALTNSQSPVANAPTAIPITNPVTAPSIPARTTSASSFINPVIWEAIKFPFVPVTKTRITYWSLILILTPVSIALAYLIISKSVEIESFSISPEKWLHVGFKSKTVGKGAK